MKNFGEKEAWAYPRTVQIFWVPPIVPGTGKATGFKFGQYIQGVHPNKSPLKNFREKGAWAYPGTAQFFRVTPIISGTGKATKFKFCMHIYRLNRNKSSLKMTGKVAVGVVRDSRKFAGHPYIWRIAQSSLRQFAIAQLSCSFVPTVFSVYQSSTSLFFLFFTSPVS